MMRLEQFGGSDAEAPPRDRPSAQPQDKPDAPPRLAAGDTGTEAAELKAAAEGHRAAETRLQNLCSALDGTLCDLHSRIDRLTSDWVEGVAEAARACLPCLAASGFATEVADAALRIAQRIELPRVALRLAPGLHAPVAALLAGRGGSERLVLVADADLPESRVLLEWEDGGALIDRSALERVAQAILERHIARLGTKENAHERH